jgi:hypothetical protein
MQKKKWKLMAGGDCDISCAIVRLSIKSDTDDEENDA